MSYTPILLVSAALLAALVGIGLLPGLVSRARERRRNQRRKQKKR